MPILKYTFLFLICWPLIGVAQDSLYLTLDRVIASVKNENLNLKKNILQAELATAEWQEAKQWWLPEVFIGTTFHHLDGSGLNTDGRIFMDVDRQSRWYGGEVNFNWDIGKGLFDTEAKKLVAESAQLFGNVTKNEVAIEGVNAYYQLLIAATKKDIFEDLIIGKEDLIQQLKVQVDVGLRLESELLLAQSNKQRLQLQLLETKQNFQQAMANMLVVLNIKDRAALNFQMTDLQLIDLVNLEELTDNSSKEHPLIIANKRKLAAVQKTADAVKKGMLIPNAGLRYHLGPFGETYSNNEFTRGFTGYIGWNIPLGELVFGGNSKVANAQQKIQALEIEQQVLAIAQEAQQYKLQLLQAKEVLALSEKGGTYAQKALEQAFIRQEAGIGNAYEILQAQEEYIQAKLLYLNAVATYNVLQHRLWVALGNDL